MLLEGIFLPLTTPFHADGRLFLRKLEYNVGRYSLTPAAGMVVLGREGEGDSLTDRETVEVLKTAIGAAADEKVMIANVGRESLAATMELVEFAAEAGYDAVAVRPPWDWMASMEAELDLYFRAIADHSPVPVVVVNDLKSFHHSHVVGQLAGHPQIIGAIHAEHAAPPRLKGLVVPISPHRHLTGLIEVAAEARREVTVTTTFAAVTGRMLKHGEPSGNFVSAASLGGTATVTVPVVSGLKTRTRKVGFQVLAGSSRTMLDCWGLGATGAVPRLAAAAPQACCEVWQAFKDGDPALAAEKQERVRLAAELVEGTAGSSETIAVRRGIAALKYGCDLNGYYGGHPRLPLLGLTGDQRAEMERTLSGLRN